MLFIPQDKCSAEQAESLITGFSEQFEVITPVTEALPGFEQSLSEYEGLCQLIDKQSIRRLNAVAYSRKCEQLIVLALDHPKVVHRLILINPELPRVNKANKFCRVVDYLIPYGLPAAGIDPEREIYSRLHRVRCPVLIITSADADCWVKECSATMLERMPNCWGKKVPAGMTKPELKEFKNFAEILQHFAQAPLTRPQKNKYEQTREMLLKHEGA